MGPTRVKNTPKITKNNKNVLGQPVAHPSALPPLQQTLGPGELLLAMEGYAGLIKKPTRWRCSTHPRLHQKSGVARSGARLSAVDSEGGGGGVPAWSRPLRFIALHPADSIRFAGISVILWMACGSEISPRSLQYIPSTREKVPAARGWLFPFCGAVRPMSHVPVPAGVWYL